MEFKQIKNGITITYNDKGLYKIIKFKKGSRSIVIIEDIEIGPGWDPKSIRADKYKGIKYYKGDGVTMTGWSRGENFGLGERYEIHISKIKAIDIPSLPKLKRDYNGFAYAIDYVLQYESP